MGRDLGKASLPGIGENGKNRVQGIGFRVQRRGEIEYWFVAIGDWLLRETETRHE
jgi:hypothetical protein